MQNFSPEDQYQLRKMQMIASKKALEAQRAQQELDRLELDLDHKYKMLSTDIDLAISIRSSLENDDLGKRNGKGNPVMISNA